MKILHKDNIVIIRILVKLSVSPKYQRIKRMRTTLINIIATHPKGKGDKKTKAQNPLTERLLSVNKHLHQLGNLS